MASSPTTQPATPLPLIDAEPPPVEATAAMAAAMLDLPPGTLIFSKGECLYVTAYTGSEYTHVGLVAADADGQPVVFDSMKGSGVRMSSVADYLSSLEDAELTLYRPRQPLDESQRRSLYKAAESQLGRPYDVTHYLTGRESAGIHCSEYVTETLAASSMIRARNPANVSPGSLRLGVARTDRWLRAETVQLLVPGPVKPSGMSCCEEFWWDTKECCRETGDWFSGLFFCR